MSTMFVGGCGYALMWYLLRRINKERDAMSIEERERLIQQGAKGDRHPDFRYTL